MRLYPIWDIAHDAEYDSLVETLLAARGLTRADLAVGPEALHPPDALTDLGVCHYLT